MRMRPHGTRWGAAVLAVVLLLALSAVPARAAGRAEGWSPWREVGTDMMTGPAVASWGPGRLDLFAVGWDRRLHHRVFTDGAWQPWEMLGAWVYSDPPAAVSWGPGRIDLLNNDTGLAQRHRSFANGVWSSWEYLPDHPDEIGSAALTSSGPGRLDVLGTLNVGGGGVQHLTFADGKWGTWKPIGPDSANYSLAAVSRAPGRIDMFRRTPDKTIVHRGFAGAWSAPHNIGGAVTGTQAAASWGPGRLDVFGRSPSGTLTHASRNAGTWSGWENLGGSVESAPAAVSWGKGRVDVFIRTAADRLLHRTFVS